MGFLVAFCDFMSVQKRYVSSGNVVSETENTSDSCTQQKLRLGLEPTFFFFPLIRITHMVSGLTEAQVLCVSAEKEFRERQSDRQEIDLLR